MALPLDASLPPVVNLGPGYTLRVTAQSIVDGSVVSQVNVSNLAILLNTAVHGATEGPPVGPFMQVPGPEA